MGVALAGELFVVATPIGNLNDLSPRAAKTLADVDLILCEDTRVSQKLLQHLSLKKPLKSLHGFNERRQIATLLNELRAGQRIAMISDAGTPAVSDPGAMLVAACLEAAIKVTTIPGPSAVTALVAAAGGEQSGWHFLGFLPRQGKERQQAITHIATAPQPTIFFESPQRIVRALADLAATAEGSRRVVIGRELTKLHEEVRSLPLNEWIKTPPREQGEFVVWADAAPTTSREEAILRRYQQLKNGAKLEDAALRQLLAWEFDINPKRIGYLLKGKP